MKTFDTKALEGALDRVIRWENRPFLYFGGTAYLGIPKQEEFIGYYLQGIERYGLNNGTSRNNNVQLAIYGEAEEEAARRYGAECGLVTSSGFLAAQMVLRHFSRRGEVLYAPDTHPALWLDRKPEQNGTFESWGRETMTRINGSAQKHWILVSNSMNNLFPEKYDFSFLSSLDASKELILVVDDSHGIGILNEGKGCYPDLPERENVKSLVVASMAKALGVDAGLVLGPRELIAGLKTTEGFLGASPPSAAGLFAFIHAGTLYRKELDRLLEHCRYFSEGLKEQGHRFAWLEGFPVYRSEEGGLAQLLRKREVLISAFPYPDQNGTPLNRIVLSSWHQKADLDDLLNILGSI